MKTDVRVRFAPSPTGYLHVGGARTALFNYLFAKRMGGTFILRIEDTDQSRYQEDAVTEIFSSLQWLGLQWDEGPEVGGPCAPYFQSQRREFYTTYAQHLVDSQKAYHCFCSPQRLQELRTEQEKLKVSSVSGYDRKCRDLSADQVKQNIEQGVPYTIRFKIPRGTVVTFNDAIRGPIEYNSDVLDDLVLLKSDGFPTYHLANVVDDHLMNITHVLRGDEWISSTPRHVLIYNAFGWKHPLFAHLPIILAENGGKLSKRKGAASVMDYKKLGFLPQAMNNFLALLGWAPGESQSDEIMSMHQMIDLFSIERISPKASVFDQKKLEWMNGVYMQNSSVESLMPDIIKLWKEYQFIPDTASIDQQYAYGVVSLMKDRSKRIAECAEQCKYYFIDPLVYDEKSVKKYFTSDTKELLETLVNQIQQISEFTKKSIENLYREIAERKAISTSKLIHPSRVALSGVDFGPGLFELIELLGKEKVIRRLTNAVIFIEQHPLTK